jgi:hypothetical protein
VSCLEAIAANEMKESVRILRNDAELFTVVGEN